MTAADTIAKIRARRITASSITQSELIELVADAAALRPTRLRAALRLSVLEAERDVALRRSRPWLDPSHSCKASIGGFCVRPHEGCSGDPCLQRARIATPADAAEIAANLVPSQARVVAKLVAKSRSADALMELAQEQAAKVRREERARFDREWGLFRKCTVCGARCVDAGYAFVCQVHEETSVLSGYSPPPRTS